MSDKNKYIKTYTFIKKWTKFGYYFCEYKSNQKELKNEDTLDRNENVCARENCPPKSDSKDWDDNWEQDERYYMYSQDTGDFNEHAANAISELKDTIVLFKTLSSKYEISEKDKKSMRNW